jgi:D-lyxose ketol-isomerase
MLCKYPDEWCMDDYYSTKGSKDGLTQRRYCRLAEWKEKKGVCPHDKTIRSRAEQLRPKIRVNRKALQEQGQTTLI